MAATPHIKFESPMEPLSESFPSTPGAQYSLFADTMDPSHINTPESYEGDSMFGDGSSVVGTPAPDAKPVKKRKSWGQQLPVPKTNLPPRKRAKTEDEKEQRRVERVYRNRKAAQSSRERKRLEVEALEQEKQTVEYRNQQLELRLRESEARNAHLEQQLAQLTGGQMKVFRGASICSQPAEQMRDPSPVTFSKELFGQQSIQRTVDPASLSPEIRPVVDSTNASTSDLTQHSAVSIGSTTALEEAFDFGNPTAYGSNSYGQHDISSLFDAPESSESDNHFLDHGVLPLVDSFTLNLDHMVGHNSSTSDEFKFDDFIDDQFETEIQSSDMSAETTASLQPQFGASSYGCDDGAIAVSV